MSSIANLVETYQKMGRQVEEKTPETTTLNKSKYVAKNGELYGSSTEADAGKVLFMKDIKKMEKEESKECKENTKSTKKVEETTRKVQKAKRSDYTKIRGRDSQKEETFKIIGSYQNGTVAWE